jgi:hypothetical protein
LRTARAEQLAVVVVVVVSVLIIRSVSILILLAIVALHLANYFLGCFVSEVAAGNAENCLNIGLAELTLQESLQFIAQLLRVFRSSVT